MKGLVDYVGEKVKLTYSDGDQTKTYYGVFQLVDDFLLLTFKDGNQMLVNKSEVKKVILK